MQDEDKTADGTTLDVDHRLFDEVLWPALAQRATAFEELKVQNSILFSQTEFFPYFSSGF